MARSLDPLFRPRSVAVIGASRSPDRIGSAILRNLLAQGFVGPVYPVNPRADEIQGLRAYGRAVEIPGDVDLAIIAVPRSAVLDAVRDCGAKGVKGIIVITAGYAETGPEGAVAQQELTRTVRAFGMRMVGPNCLGLLNTDPAVRLNATFAGAWPPRGSVSFSSQSGALGLAILDYARGLGIGLRQFVSVGNKAEVSGNDLLEYWEDDPETRVILLYLESFGNPRRFLEIARRVGRKKPIIAVKSGRSRAGVRAAQSHTGALAGEEAAVDALLTQAGVLRANTLEELFDAASLLASQPVPRGPRVGILTNAGGPAIMAADACEGRGLKLLPLASSTMDRLRSFLRPEASVANPVDMIASAVPSMYEGALRCLLDDPSVDAVLALHVPTGSARPEAVAEVLCRVAADAAKPIVTCFLGSHEVEKARAIVRNASIPSYTFPESAAVALSMAARYGAWLARPEEEPRRPVAVDADRVRSMLRAPAPRATGTRWLHPDEVNSVLGAYDIPAPASRVATTAEGARSAAESIGYPVALKLVSAAIPHKTDVGGVRLGLANADEVLAAYRALEERMTSLGRRAEMLGVQIQAMAPKGVETLVGVSRDPSFGPLVGFGIGGTLAEVWKDMVFRLGPLRRADAYEMMDGIRATKLLHGFRGAPAADREAIADVLVRVSQLADDLPELLELDINPLVALAPGQGALAVDTRMLVRT